MRLRGYSEDVLAHGHDWRETGLVARDEVLRSFWAQGFYSVLGISGQRNQELLS